jgi:hypothetical protein
LATGVTVGVADGAVGLAEGVDDGEKTGSTTDEKVTRSPSAVTSASVERTADTAVPGVEE